jgi:hypothetical protein
MKLFRNPHVVPRYAGWVGKAEVDAFFEEGRDAGSLSLVENSGMENRRKLEVPGGVSWIRVAENHGDGWEFRVAGESGWDEVGRAPDGSMLLDLTGRIESGGGSVEMRYEPPLRRAGLVVSAISVLLVCGLSIGEAQLTGKRSQSPS